MSLVRHCRRWKPWGKCCAHAHNILKTLSGFNEVTHVVCFMSDTVYYVQIHDTEVRVIDFNQRKDIMLGMVAFVRAVRGGQQ
jgi:hypothetical protein